MHKETRKHIVLLGLLILILAWSFIKPYRYDSWFLLSMPAIIYVSVLTCTYKRFRFTTFAYLMVFIHVTILLIGAKYTYGHNPLFLELKEIFNLSRNHFDRVGHFAQGFTPFFLVREFFLRKGYFKKGKYFYLLAFSLILSISAAYELLEFAVTVITGEPMEVILSTQGDPWDTHWDMIMALIGAVSAQLFLGRLHDKQINEMM